MNFSTFVITVSLRICHFIEIGQVHVRVDLSPEDMDSFIFCLAAKKSSGRLVKELADLSTYCPERRPADKYLSGAGVAPGSYQLMTEVPEVAQAMLDTKVVSVIKKFPEVSNLISHKKLCHLPQGNRYYPFL